MLTELRRFATVSRTDGMNNLPVVQRSFGAVRGSSFLHFLICGLRWSFRLSLTWCCRFCLSLSTRGAAISPKLLIDINDTVATPDALSIAAAFLELGINRRILP